MFIIQEYLFLIPNKIIIIKWKKVIKPVVIKK